jgi:Uma2 family endonuclease
MTAQPALATISLDEYFYFDTFVHSGDVRHEYVDGVVVAMTGGTIAHAQLMSSVARQLMLQLKVPCRVFVAELRVKAESHSRVFYPDVSVICGPVETTHVDRHGETVTNPRVIIEVLSKSTSDYDVKTKLPVYQSIESLRSILYVHQTERRVEVWTKLPKSGEWSWYEFSGGSFEMVGIAASIDVDGLYAGIIGGIVE